MRRAARHLAIAALLAATASAVPGGCARERLLARGPFTLDAAPALVRFGQVVPFGSDRWDLCLEFERPDAGAAPAGRCWVAARLASAAPLRVRSLRGGAGD